MAPMSVFEQNDRCLPVTFFSEQVLTEEQSMKSSAEVAVKDKLHEAKGKAKEELGKVMNDPTLEGKDENKVGRVQRKAGRRTTISEGDRAGHPLSVKNVPSSSSQLS